MDAARKHEREAVPPLIAAARMLEAQLANVEMNDTTAGDERTRAENITHLAGQIGALKAK